MTMGRKEEKRNLFITADVSSAIRALKTQIKMDTMCSGRKDNMMTEEDIDQLFEGTRNEPAASSKNLQLEKIKQLLESDPEGATNKAAKGAGNAVRNQTPKEVQKTKDFADSIKYLELERGEEDKLLTALRDENLVKVEPNANTDKTAAFRDQFVVGKQIGEGAYGSVRIALYTSMNKRIAIKVYEKKKIREPQRRKSVRREIKILQQIAHRNIVQIFDVYETNNHINLIMEYVPGVCLSSYLKSQPEFRLSEKAAKQMFREIVDGVVYLHALDICHRDIKLDNILLDA